MLCLIASNPVFLVVSVGRLGLTLALDTGMIDGLGMGIVDVLAKDLVDGFGTGVMKDDCRDIADESCTGRLGILPIVPPNTPPARFVFFDELGPGPPPARDPVAFLDELEDRDGGDEV